MSSYLDDLYDNRIIMITGEINEESCSEAIGRIAMLDLLGDNNEPIIVLINTQGGLTASAMGVADVIENTSCPVITVCIGLANSAGSIILAAGKQRYALPNSEIMIHQHWQEFSESINHTELINHAEASKQSYNGLVDFYKKHSNLNKRKLKSLLIKDSYLSPETALEYGFIDGVGWNLNQWIMMKEESVSPETDV